MKLYIHGNVSLPNYYRINAVRISGLRCEDIGIAAVRISWYIMSIVYTIARGSLYAHNTRVSKLDCPG